MRGLVLVLIGALVALAAGQTFFDDIDTSLHLHQTTNGAFKSADTADAESTANGVFLASLFVPSGVRLDSTKSFLASLQNGDGGFGSKNGLASDIESTKHAFLALTQLKAAPSNRNAIASFLKSLRDESSGLYANKAGAKANLESTAYAFQILAALGAPGEAQLKEGSTKISAFLKHSWSSEFFATPDPSLHPISVNYFATVLAKATGYDLSAHAEKLCKFISEQLTKLPASTAHAEVVFHGIAVLKTLSEAPSKLDCISKVDEDALRTSFTGVATTLNSAAHLYQALVLTDEFADIYRSRAQFQTLEGVAIGSRLIFGTTVKSTFATEPVNPNLEVALHARLPNAAVLDTFTFSPEKKLYVGKEPIKTSDGLGKAVFTYHVSLNLPVIGFVAGFDHVDTRFIGYGIAIDAEATLEGGRKVSEGAAVATGTEFSFGVSLHSDAEANIVSGDFDVIFSVLDASLVEIHNEKSSRRGNNSPIRFSYTLKNANLPAGELVFRFDVTTSLTGVHTSDSVSYRLSAPMVASNVQLGKQYKLGETVKISMEPGVLSGLRSAVPLFAGKDGARTFFLDVKSPGGVLIYSVRGVSQGARVNFELPLGNSLDSIGTQLVSFRFVAANTETVQLANYDSQAGELYDESNALSFSVPVDLAYQPASGEKAPAASAFVYGADIVYNFKVKDLHSGLEVKPGKEGVANVYLSLRPTDGARGQASVHIPARYTAKGFAVNWNINPNAVRGAGVVELSAEDVDGNAYALREDGKKVQLQVNIGGDIVVTPVPLSSTIFDRRGLAKSVFVVKFSLACKGKQLSGAALKAVVERIDEHGAVTEVASNLPVATSGADYEVSWTTATRAPSGKYRVRFYREADRIKADAAGIFEMSFDHDSGATTKLPVRTEFLAVLALLGLYIAAHSRRTKYEKTK